MMSGKILKMIVEWMIVQVVCCHVMDYRYIKHYKILFLIFHFEAISNMIWCMFIEILSVTLSLSLQGNASSCFLFRSF